MRVISLLKLLVQNYAKNYRQIDLRVLVWQEI